jgi:hypothetical protein
MGYIGNGTTQRMDASMTPKCLILKASCQVMSRHVDFMSTFFDVTL